MSDDPVEYAIGRYKLVQEIMPDIVEKIKSKSDTWESVYQSYFILMRQIMTSMDVVSRQIGGVYVTRHPSNTPSTKPYEAVPYRTRKAMETLNNYAFNSEGLKPLSLLQLTCNEKEEDLIFMMRMKILNFMIIFFPDIKEFLII